MFSQKNQILLFSFFQLLKYLLLHWPWNGLTWRVVGRENVFFFTFILIERNKQKTIDELYKLKNLTLVKMCNLSNKSTNKTKKKKTIFVNFIFQFQNKKFFFFISFPLRSPDWLGPSFWRNLWCQIFFSRIVEVFFFKKNVMIIFQSFKAFFVMFWKSKRKMQSFFVFVFGRLSCPEDGIIDRISRSNGGRVWDQQQSRALNAKRVENNKN